MGKQKSSILDFVLAHDVAHIKRLEFYSAQVDQIYDAAVKDFALLGAKGIPGDEIFSFSKSPGAKAAADKIIAEFQTKMFNTIGAGMSKEWVNAALKTNILLQKTLPNGLDTSGYMTHNLEALKAFQLRKTDGLNLSDRVWKYSKQFKNEIELGIDVGLGEGKTAQQLSRDLRKYLQEPDKLFHKVKSKHGGLKLSKAAAAYHPGQGVYRSSYKNAMRLSRTEINMAYRESDAHKWRQIDFVVGIEVRLSNNPLHCPVCVQLAGKYPKEFRFVGWHPHCRCHAIPIMNTEEEFDQMQADILEGKKVFPADSTNAVTEIPQGFKSWVVGNKENAQNWKSTPYFVKDNFKNGDLTKGLNFSPGQYKVEAKKLKLEAQEEEKAAKKLATAQANKIKQAAEAAQKAAAEQAAKIAAEQAAQMAAKIAAEAKAAEQAAAAAAKAAAQAAAKEAAELAAKAAAEKAAQEAADLAAKQQAEAILKKAIAKEKAGKYAQAAIDKADALGIKGKEYESLKKMLENPDFNANTVSNKMSDLNKVLKSHKEGIAMPLAPAEQATVKMTGEAAKMAPAPAIELDPLSYEAIEAQFGKDDAKAVFGAFQNHVNKELALTTQGYKDYITKELYWANQKIAKYPTSPVMVKLLEKELAEVEAKFVAKMAAEAVKAAEAAAKAAELKAIELAKEAKEQAKAIKEAEKAFKARKTTLKNNGYKYETKAYTADEVAELERLNAEWEVTLSKNQFNFFSSEVQSAQSQLAEYTIKLGEKYHATQPKIKPLLGATDAQGKKALKEYLSAPAKKGWAPSGQVGGVYKGDSELSRAMAYAQQTGIPYEDLSLVSRYFRGSGFINNYLIGKDTEALGGLLDKYRTAVNHVIEKMPRYKGITYRGVSIRGDLDKQITGVLEAFAKGEAYEYAPVISTSTNIHVAQGFSGGGSDTIMFKIHSKAGVNGKQVSYYFTEDEVVLRSGSKFKIKSARRVKRGEKGTWANSGGWEVEMEEII